MFYFELQLPFPCPKVSTVRLSPFCFLTIRSRTLALASPGSELAERGPVFYLKTGSPAKCLSSDLVQLLFGCIKTCVYWVWKIYWGWKRLSVGVLLMPACDWWRTGQLVLRYTQGFQSTKCLPAGIRPTMSLRKWSDSCSNESNWNPRRADFMLLACVCSIKFFRTFVGLARVILRSDWAWGQQHLSQAFTGSRT